MIWEDIKDSATNNKEHKMPTIAKGDLLPPRLMKAVEVAKATAALPPTDQHKPPEEPCAIGTQGPKGWRSKGPLGSREPRAHVVFHLLQLHKSSRSERKHVSKL